MTEEMLEEDKLLLQRVRHNQSIETVEAFYNSYKINYFRYFTILDQLNLKHLKGLI